MLNDLQINFFRDGSNGYEGQWTIEHILERQRSSDPSDVVRRIPSLRKLQIATLSYSVTYCVEPYAFADELHIASHLQFISLIRAKLLGLEGQVVSQTNYLRGRTVNQECRGTNEFTVFHKRLVLVHSETPITDECLEPLRAWVSARRIAGQDYEFLGAKTVYDFVNGQLVQQFVVPVEDQEKLMARFHPNWHSMLRPIHVRRTEDVKHLKERWEKRHLPSTPTASE